MFQSGHIKKSIINMKRRNKAYDWFMHDYIINHEGHLNHFGYTVYAENEGKALVSRPW